MDYIVDMPYLLYLDNYLYCFLIFGERQINELFCSADKLIEKSLKKLASYDHYNIEYDAEEKFYDPQTLKEIDSEIKSSKKLKHGDWVKFNE